MPAFSNGTEWDIWSAEWCQQCRNDVNEDCPIVMVALMGGMPEQWTKIGLGDYDCSEFEPLPDEVT